MVDPISLTAIGTLIGGLAGAGSLAATALGPKPKTPSMPAAAPPVQNPIGSQTTNAQSTQGPSFLAAAAAPAGNQTSGSRSLLGQ